MQLPTQNEPDRIPEFKPREKIFRVQKESQEWGDKLDIATVGDLNEKVTRGGIQDILLIQEAMQEAKISEIASEIAAAGNKKFVMIAGPSSSGKTTFSHRLSHSAGCPWNETASDRSGQLFCGSGKNTPG